MPHVIPVTSRREFLMKAGGGFGALAFAHLLGLDGFSARAAQNSPTKGAHFAPRAKSVIWLFMEGGPSHIDLFDPKPELDRLAGKPMPESFGRPITAMGTADNTIMPTDPRANQKPILRRYVLQHLAKLCLHPFGSKARSLIQQLEKWRPLQ